MSSWVPSVIFDEREFDYNVISLPGDNPFLPAMTNQVFVLGGVEHPGPQPFNPYFTADQYVAMAGGVEPVRGKHGKIDQVVDGEYRRISGGKILNPGDTVRVPTKVLTEQFWLTFLISLSSLAVSAVAVSTRF